MAGKANPFNLIQLQEKALHRMHEPRSSESRAEYIRYAVPDSGKSMLCAQHTPRYFTERQKKHAETYAKAIGSYVVDLFRR